MARWFSHRTDENAERLYEYAQAHGIAVYRLGRPVDAIFGCRGVNVLVEVKRERARPRKNEAKQRAFLATWPGWVVKIRTEADVDTVIAHMFERQC